MIKLKNADKYEKYSNPEVFSELNTYDYQLIDIFKDATKNTLYYYFEGPNKITDIMYHYIYLQLRTLVQDYAYIKKVEPNKTLKKF